MELQSLEHHEGSLIHGLLGIGLNNILQVINVVYGGSRYWKGQVVLALINSNNKLDEMVTFLFLEFTYVRFPKCQCSWSSGVSNDNILLALTTTYNNWGIKVVESSSSVMSLLPIVSKSLIFLFGGG